MMRGALERLSGRSLLAAWFESDSPLAPFNVEPDVFLLAMIHALHYRMRQVIGKLWQDETLAELFRDPARPSLLDPGRG